MPKYKSPAIEFTVAGKKVFVRALQKSAIIDTVGKINLQEWLEAQSDAVAEVSKAKKSKAPAPRIAYLEGKVIFPGLLERYMETGSSSVLWEVQSSPDAFAPDSVDEANAKAQALKEESEEKDTEIAALKARLAELEEKSKEDEGDE